jgi:hypothetical protein
LRIVSLSQVDDARGRWLTAMCRLCQGDRADDDRAEPEEEMPESQRKIYSPPKNVGSWYPKHSFCPSVVRR